MGSITASLHVHPQNWVICKSERKKMHLVWIIYNFLKTFFFLFSNRSHSHVQDHPSHKQAGKHRLYYRIFFLRRGWGEREQACAGSICWFTLQTLPMARAGPELGDWNSGKATHPSGRNPVTWAVTCASQGLHLRQSRTGSKNYVSISASLMWDLGIFTLNTHPLLTFKL